MTPTAPQLDITVIYFIYGLSFFTLGLAVFMESGRIPMLAEARILRPLAVFGILHGLHEWIELFMMPLAGQGLLPPSAAFIRIALLVLSFASLFAYGIRAIHWPTRPFIADSLGGLLILIFYFGLLFISGNTPRLNPNGWADNADVLARYLIAIPSGLLAAAALRSQYLRWRETNPSLAVCLGWAGGGFCIYGLTHLFVKNSSMTLSPYLTADYFKEYVGIPIQGLRSITAAVVAVGLIRAIHHVDQRRRQQLQLAQQEKLDALDKLQSELEKRKKMRRELLRHTVIAQEEERKRIARELHDETSQALTANSLSMSTLKTMIPHNPEAFEIINRSQDLCRSMARGLHRLVHDLRPAQLDDLGLVPSLHYLIDEARRNSGIRINFMVHGNIQRIDPLAETVLFRITQEAITNIARHADTDHGTIQLYFSPLQISLEIKDSGKGFSNENIPVFGGGCGLAGMRERAESVDGDIMIESHAGQGTKIEVVIPLKPSAAAQEQSE